MKKTIVMAALFALCVGGLAASETTKTLELSAAGLKDLEIRAGAGSLKVVGREGLGSIEVKAEIVARRVGDDEMGEFLKDRVELVLEKRGDGAVLISRIRHATSGRWNGARRRPSLIAGLVPVADGPMSNRMRRALIERQDLLESRATALAEAAVAGRAAWVRRLGAPPVDSRQRDLWVQEVRVVAAYRDLWQVDSDKPVGPAGDSDRQRIDEARARRAIRRAADIAAEAGDRGRSGVAADGPVLG
jgi:hypothetical protein